MLETLANGAIVFDRADCEVEGKPAEIVFCFVPGNAMTPFVVWHRLKNSQSMFWGKFYPGNECEHAAACFKDLRAAARKNVSREARQRDAAFENELARELQVLPNSKPANQSATATPAIAAAK